MKITTMRYLIMLLLFALITACTGKSSPEPTATFTATSAPTSTETSIPVPTLTFTPTVTALPTETPIPMPASLTGKIFLSGDNVTPFVSSVELRQKSSFMLIGKSDTDSMGVFKIENIEPGFYELWILITSKPLMVSGCNDISLPDSTWKMGIKFSEDKALTMENSYLSKALLLSENLQSSSLKASGFFGVLPNFEIKSGIENKIEITLMCK